MLNMLGFSVEGVEGELDVVVSGIVLVGEIVIGIVFVAGDQVEAVGFRAAGVQGYHTNSLIPYM